MLEHPQNENFIESDKWQIPREHVVINRKIGEGAFGTVYGGEAQINNEWVAVAVKSLKQGATTEIKVCLCLFICVSVCMWVYVHIFYQH